MEKQSNAVIGSMEWIEEQRAICDAATPGPWHYVDNGFDGYVESDSGKKIFGGEPCEGRLEPDDLNVTFIVSASAGYRAALDALEAKTKLLNRVLPEGTPAWMAYNTPTIMTPKDAAMRIREHMRHHGISEPQSIGISTALLMGADSLEREAEKDATIEEQAKRIKFLENHILSITPAYKKLRDKLLDERDRLTAERDAEKRRADAAVNTINLIDYQLEKHQECAKYGNRQYAHGIRDARKIIAQLHPVCAEKTETPTGDTQEESK